MFELSRTPDVTISGYRVAFHPNEHNSCPGCSKSNWMIGRMTAECAFCGTALPLHGGGTFGTGLFRSRARPIPPLTLAA